MKASTPLSAEVPRVLKTRGFKFVGPVIVYASMKATGIVDDHVAHCFRRSEAQKMARPWLPSCGASAPASRLFLPRSPKA